MSAETEHLKLEKWKRVQDRLNSYITSYARDRFQLEVSDKLFIVGDEYLERFSISKMWTYENMEFLLTLFDSFLTFSDGDSEDQGHFQPEFEKVFDYFVKECPIDVGKARRKIYSYAEELKTTNTRTQIGKLCVLLENFSNLVLDHPDIFSEDSMTFAEWSHELLRNNSFTALYMLPPSPAAKRFCFSRSELFEVILPVYIRQLLECRRTQCKFDVEKVIKEVLMAMEKGLIDDLVEDD